jgi:hypothetical protein
MEPLPDDLVGRDSTPSSYRAPEVLGLAAFALGLAALLGFGLLSGQVVLALAEQSGPPTKTLQVLAGLTGAALAAIPLLLGLQATRLLLDDDPLWVSAVSRAAVLLGAVAVLLRLGHVLIAALADSPSFYGF